MRGVPWFLVLLPLLCLTSVAGALPLSAYHVGQDDTLDLYVSGSSAQDNTLEQLFRFMCERDTLDIYRSNGGNIRLLFCRTPTGTKIAFHKSSIGGSGSGVGPLLQATPVEFINVPDLQLHFDDRCPATGRVHHAADGALSAYTTADCANPSPAHEVPELGISDVEPRFFVDLYKLPPGAVAQLNVTSVNAFIFGVPVTVNLRNAMQAARFAAGNPCNPANPHYHDVVKTASGTRATRGETERCMPGFTRAQVAGIFAGTLTDWSQVLTPSGAPLAGRAAQGRAISSPPGITPPADEHVHVCRRVDTSGTQASYEMFFLNQRCATGVHSFVKTGDTVFLGSGTADVKACLDQLDHRNIWAVGIMSTENVPSAAEDRWRFVKLDGIAPTLLNTYSGRWQFFAEPSYQWRNERSGHPLSGPKLGFVSQLTLQLKNPAIVRMINRDFRHSWGDAGIMSVRGVGISPPGATPGHPVDDAAVAADPVLGVTHDGNNCGAVLAESPTPLP